jgi:hypothetical protein
VANTTIKDAVLLDDPIVVAAMAQARANRAEALSTVTFTVEALGGLTISLKDALVLWQTLKGTSAQLFADEADREDSVAVRTSRELYPQLKALGISLEWKNIFALAASL